MTRKLALLAVIGVAVPTAGCISVSPPDKPIEINLNVDIKQEVAVRLQEDVDTLINQNPGAFPKGTAKP